MNDKKFKNNQHTNLGPYSQSTNAGNILFISGQIGIYPDTGIIPNDIKQQTWQSLINIKKIIEERKLNISNIIKTTLFIIDINELTTINLIYKQFFEEHNNKFPARSCIEVNNLPKRAKIEIEAIASYISII